MALRSFRQVHKPASAMARHRSPRDRPPMCSGATFTLQGSAATGTADLACQEGISSAREGQLAAKLAGCHACCNGQMFHVLFAAYPPFRSLIVVPKGEMSKGRPLRAHSSRQACIHKARTLQHHTYTGNMQGCISLPVHFRATCSMDQTMLCMTARGWLLRQTAPDYSD
jgi:hypothetical protein